METNKKQFIEKLILDEPDIKVHYINQLTQEIWKKEKFLRSILNDDVLLNQFNLRKICRNEIVLDVENPNNLIKIEEKLKEKQWNYEIWNTSSRGVHIKLIFNQLKEFDIKKRNRIRKYIIREFECDESKSSEKTWLAMEWTPHFKSGKEKILSKELKEYSENKFKEEFLRYIDEELKNDINKIEGDEIFKDYLEKDPYLNYVLTHEINDGDRNNILFKNLAIGLVKSGLSRDDIEVIAEKIVNNCPGKVINEFMGWVDKAITGELNEYNKSEIVKWANKYGLPIMYKMTDGEKELKEALTIKDLWNIIWDMEIAEQPVWKDMCFYNLLGTILDERQNDLRVHAIFVSPTSSGKDMGVNLVEETLKRIGYKTICPSEITDKTLIGGINDEIRKRNAKLGLTEDNKEIEEKGMMKTTKHTYTTPIEYGVLKTDLPNGVHWIGMAEAQTIFKPGAYNTGIQRILRQAMDKKRQIEKGVGGIIIRVNTNTSFLLASYPMDNILWKLTETGIFQRVLYYQKELTQKESTNIRKKKNINKYNKDVKDNYNKEDYMAELGGKLKDLKMWYDENKDKLILEKDIFKLIDEKDDEMEREYSYLDVGDFDTIHSMLRRAPTVENIIYLNAIVNKRFNINKEDVEISYDLFEECLNSIKNLIVKMDEVTKRSSILFSICKKHGKISSTQLFLELKSKLPRLSTSTFSALLKKEKANGTIIEAREGKIKYIVYVEDVINDINI